jgi:membrane protein
MSADIRHAACPESSNSIDDEDTHHGHDPRIGDAGTPRGARARTRCARPGGGPGMIALRAWWRLAREAVSAWSDDYAPSMGAALSYYSVFSMGPLLLIVTAIAGLVFGEQAARGEIFGQLRGLMGDAPAHAIEALIDSLGKPTTGIASALFGLVALGIGATTVFAELQDALDRIWRAPARNRTRGVWGVVRARLLSFGMILGVAFLLMVSLVLSAAISALGRWWGGAFGASELLLQVINFVVGFLMTTAVFAMIYKLMPRVQVRWHDVWLGAAITAALFGVGRLLIGLYIGKSGITSGFGAAASIAMVFVWVYYSAQIFLLGAEFTWVYARTYGSLAGMNRPAANLADAHSGGVVRRT